MMMILYCISQDQKTLDGFNRINRALFFDGGGKKKKKGCVEMKCIATVI